MSETSLSPYLSDCFSEYKIIGSKSFCPQNFKDTVKLFLAFIVASEKFDVNLISHTFEESFLLRETFKIFSFSLGF